MVEHILWNGSHPNSPSSDEPRRSHRHEPRSLAFEQLVAAARFRWVSKGDLVHIERYLEGLSKSDSRLKDASAKSKVTGLVIRVDARCQLAQWDNMRSRTALLDEIAGNYSLFGSLEVTVELFVRFTETDFTEKVKEVEQVAPLLDEEFYVSYSRYVTTLQRAGTGLHI
ncbi:hypothetical protein WG66_014450 [Moniliophthora roreri]|nr:hypothetical protein WG66_014450 [Moniliophthora roreri]